MRKRLISLVLTFLMVLTLIPTAAFAATYPTESVSTDVASIKVGFLGCEDNKVVVATKTYFTATRTIVGDGTYPVMYPSYPSAKFLAYAQDGTTKLTLDNIKATYNNSLGCYEVTFTEECAGYTLYGVALEGYGNVLEMKPEDYVTLAPKWTGEDNTPYTFLASHFGELGVASWSDEAGEMDENLVSHTDTHKVVVTPYLNGSDTYCFDGEVGTVTYDTEEGSGRGSANEVYKVTLEQYAVLDDNDSQKLQETAFDNEDTFIATYSDSSDYTNIAYRENLYNLVSKDDIHVFFRNSTVWNYDDLNEDGEWDYDEDWWYTWTEIAPLSNADNFRELDDTIQFAYPTATSFSGITWDWTIMDEHVSNSEFFFTVYTDGKYTAADTYQIMVLVDSENYQSDWTWYDDVLNRNNVSVDYTVNPNSYFHYVATDTSMGFNQLVVEPTRAATDTDFADDWDFENWPDDVNRVGVLDFTQDTIRVSGTKDSEVVMLKGNSGIIDASHEGWTYDIDNNVLTINSLWLDSGWQNCNGIVLPENATIIVEAGTRNAIENLTPVSGSGIYCKGDLTIKSTGTDMGTLYIYDQSYWNYGYYNTYGIRVDGDLTIENLILTVESEPYYDDGSDTAAFSYGIVADDITINNSYIYMYNVDEAIYNGWDSDGDMTITDSVLLLDVQDYGLYVDEGDLVASNTKIIVGYSCDYYASTTDYVAEKSYCDDEAIYVEEGDAFFYGCDLELYAYYEAIDINDGDLFMDDCGLNLLSHDENAIHVYDGFATLTNIRDISITEGDLLPFWTFHELEIDYADVVNANFANFCISERSHVEAYDYAAIAACEGIYMENVDARIAATDDAAIIAFGDAWSSYAPFDDGVIATLSDVTIRGDNYLTIGYIKDSDFLWDYVEMDEDYVDDVYGIVGRNVVLNGYIDVDGYSDDYPVAAVYASNDLTVESGIVNAYGISEDDDYRTYGLYAGHDVILNGGDIYAEGSSYGIYAGNDILGEGAAQITAVATDTDPAIGHDYGYAYEERIWAAGMYAGNNINITNCTSVTAQNDAMAMVASSGDIVINATGAVEAVAYSAELGGYVAGYAIEARNGDIDITAYGITALASYTEIGGYEVARQGYHFFDGDNTAAVWANNVSLNGKGGICTIDGGYNAVYAQNGCATLTNFGVGSSVAAHSDVLNAVTVGRNPNLPIYDDTVDTYAAAVAAVHGSVYMSNVNGAVTNTQVAVYAATDTTIEGVGELFVESEYATAIVACNDVNLNGETIRVLATATTGNCGATGIWAFNDITGNGDAVVNVVAGGMAMLAYNAVDIEACTSIYAEAAYAGIYASASDVTIVASGDVVATTTALELSESTDSYYVNLNYVIAHPGMGIYANHDLTVTAANVEAFGAVNALRARTGSADVTCTGKLSATDSADGEDDNAIAVASDCDIAVGTLYVKGGRSGIYAWAGSVNIAVTGDAEIYAAHPDDDAGATSFSEYQGNCGIRADDSYYGVATSGNIAVAVEGSLTVKAGGTGISGKNVSVDVSEKADINAGKYGIYADGSATLTNFAAESAIVASGTDYRTIAVYAWGDIAIVDANLYAEGKMYGIYTELGDIVANAADAAIEASSLDMAIYARKGNIDMTAKTLEAYADGYWGRGGIVASGMGNYYARETRLYNAELGKITLNVENATATEINAENDIIIHADGNVYVGSEYYWFGKINAQWGKITANVGGDLTAAYIGTYDFDATITDLDVTLIVGGNLFVSQNIYTEYSTGSDITIDVEGDATVMRWIDTYDATNSNITIDVAGDLSVGGYYDGIYTNCDNSSITVTVGGDLELVGTETEIWTGGDNSPIEVTVTGNISGADLSYIQSNGESSDVTVSAKDITFVNNASYTNIGTFGADSDVVVTADTMDVNSIWARGAYWDENGEERYNGLGGDVTIDVDTATVHGGVWADGNLKLTGDITVNDEFFTGYDRDAGEYGVAVYAGENLKVTDGSKIVANGTLYGIASGENMTVTGASVTANATDALEGYEDQAAVLVQDTLSINSTAAYDASVTANGKLNGVLVGDLSINGQVADDYRVNGLKEAVLTASAKDSGVLVLGNTTLTGNSIINAEATAADGIEVQFEGKVTANSHWLKNGESNVNLKTGTEVGYIYLNYFNELDGSVTPVKFFNTDNTDELSLVPSAYKYAVNRPYGGGTGGSVATTVPTVVVSSNMPMLRKGNTGDSVKTLQTKLNALGYNCGTVDGVFGSATYAAVCAYQKAMGLTVDGVVGNQTWSKLGVSTIATVAAATTVTTTTAAKTLLRQGNTGDAVKALQTKLNSLGYDCGTVDGVFGSKTYAAVCAYQTAMGLTVDGVVGNQTWAKLG